ncbi:putative uncharacterized protein DDB_G0274535 [Panonychus citri]|uniref:putative uncharacterized protein DDB_G0274535 n=1 Tax=Panonychus citri TaxID=50023 RepID=UPI00230834BD|nr:putative uncharacterized protein DDB_G0274535 [Panonychus citri]XP_053201471.1 putative uncharacterized protein DDB_G0274535 [Panonychus citri]XP_053201472.1 putative uncharacterized protein DDB_G0274535 [Panonychus citri]
MEVNQEKMDNPLTKSIRDSIDCEQSNSSSKVIKEENDKENRFTNDDDDARRKSDQSLFDMIKSRPKRPNRKVPSRLMKSTNDKPDIVINESTSGDEKKPKQSTQSTKTTTTINSTLDIGLDTFFQSSLVTFKRRTFADVYPMDEVLSKCLSQSTSKSTQNSNDKSDKNNNNEMNDSHDRENKLTPLSLADRIARSRSSPNLIDPRKMLLPGDPRHNLSIIKELRSRQKSGESTEISQNNNNNNLNHHSSLLSELRAKNKPFCSKKDDPTLVRKDKPPISLLKPSLKSFSPSGSSSSKLSSSSSSASSSSSFSSSVQQSGQFFNVKLRETKSNKVNNLIKSYTRASFPVNSETDSGEKVKRNSEPNCNQVNHQDNQHEIERKDNSDSDSVSVSGGGEDDKRLSKEASALNTDDDEKEEKSHRSSGESSSSSDDDDDEEEDEEKQAEKKGDNEDDNCHQNGTKSSGKLSC